MIERLLALGPELVMRSCVLGKDTLRLFPFGGRAVYPLWWPSLTIDLQTEPKKGALLWFGWAETECQVHTNERTIAKLHLEHRMRNCIIASQNSCIFRKLVCVGNTRKLSKSESLFTCM